MLHLTAATPAVDDLSTTVDTTRSAPALQQEPDMLNTIDHDELAGVTGGTMLRSAGQAIGFGAGVAVTGALRVVPGWNQQVEGQPAGFQKRHESVVGPKVESYSSGLPAGPWKDFTSGVGAGATAAPGWSFRHGV